MIMLSSLFRTCLSVPLKLLVKAQTVPTNPIAELGIDPSKPIVYALPFESKVDLLTVQRAIKKLGLVDPFSPLVLQNQSMQRVVYTFSNSDKTPDVSTPHASTELFHRILTLHCQYPDLEVQIVPIAIFWGREPGKEEEDSSHITHMNLSQRARGVIQLGRDCFIHFSKPVSIHYIASNYGTDYRIARKLVRIARVHFARQRFASAGPKLPKRDVLIHRLLNSELVIRTIEEEAKAKNIAVESVEKEANAIAQEIAANFSYRVIRTAQRILGWLWNKIYHGLHISHAEKVRQLTQKGHSIVYVPCHRSHMDYLLLSYVLYNQGLVPPHIAAGINLSFFPAGPVFRKSGAFFLRRTFNGNRLYSTIFKQYLTELFDKGYSVEFFSEGGRSRTGRLLTPKTGMLAMTIQSMLTNIKRPVTLVPVYIGYEHVMEVSTYANELRGKEKENESVGQIFKTIRKLGNFGKAYVNFGEPISLNHYLAEKVPDWFEHTAKEKPTWLNPVVNELSTKMMQHINSAVTVNALTFCALALLAARQRALSREQLATQINCYLGLLQHVHYSDNITIPTEPAEKLIEHAEGLDKFVIETDSIGDIISLDRHQSILMTYYRNNIIHLFSIPSLVAKIIIEHKQIAVAEIIAGVKLLYPFLKNELFIHYSQADLAAVVEQILTQLDAQGLLQFTECRTEVSLKQDNSQTLLLLSNTIKETLQRYAIAMSQLMTSSAPFDKVQLEKSSQLMAQRLGRLHGINAPEFFDKNVFSTFLRTLQQEDYIGQEHWCNKEKTETTMNFIAGLLSPEVKLSIVEQITSHQGAQ